MNLPSALTAQVERALEEAGRSGRIARAEPIAGGCISRGTRLIDERGASWFLKWNPGAPLAMFEAEADGLCALAAARAIRIPEVIAIGGGAGSPAWLLLEYIDPGREGPGYAAQLGSELAALHRAARGGWGWERDNIIGSLPQENRPTRTWGEFWRDARLAPQLAQARGRGHLRSGRAEAIDRVIEHTPALLADIEAEGPSLLHGDLWSGNVYADAGGRPVLIDPAVYRGHREVDLAMSELFGGFPAGWPKAYAEAWPIDAGYRAFRRDLYQLYYLLVHVNLFGAGYEAGCVAAAEGALRGA